MFNPQTCGKTHETGKGAADEQLSVVLKELRLILVSTQEINKSINTSP